MIGKNVNYGFNYGHIGDEVNIYIDGAKIERILEKKNYCLNINEKIKAARPAIYEMLKTYGANNSKMSLGMKNILTLELISKHFDSLNEEFEKYENDMRSNRYPLKIRVTQLVDDCAQGVYYNGGNVENDVWEIVDSILILICTIKYGSNFYASRVYVGRHLYYELYPAEE